MKIAYERNAKIADEAGLDYSTPIPLSYFNENNFNAFKAGYIDAINSRLDMHNYCQINKMVYVEDFFYAVGFRNGVSDYNLEVNREPSLDMNSDYKKIVTLSMTIGDFGDNFKLAEISLSRAEML